MDLFALHKGRKGHHMHPCAAAMSGCSRPRAERRSSHHHLAASCYSSRESSRDRICDAVCLPPLDPFVRSGTLRRLPPRLSACETSGWIDLSGHSRDGCP
jgi:hypothetical protein